jgi:hypothetical protein
VAVTESVGDQRTLLFDTEALVHSANEFRPQAAALGSAKIAPSPSPHCDIVIAAAQNTFPRDLVF